jgi:hypothetical protein
LLLARFPPLSDYQHHEEIFKNYHPIIKEALQDLFGSNNLSDFNALSLSLMGLDGYYMEPNPYNPPFGVRIRQICEQFISDTYGGVLLEALRDNGIKFFNGTKGTHC